MFSVMHSSETTELSLLGHPHKMFRFRPSPSDSKGLVGRSEKKKLKINFKVMQLL